MHFSLPLIYPITDVAISGLSHPEQVARLAGGGAKLVQIREKNAASDEFYRSALEAVRVGKELGVRVLINDRVDIARVVGAAGVHLGQDDMRPEHAREQLGAGAIIGYSTHSVEQAAAAARGPIDYIAFGPVFPTSTKVDPDAVVGLSGLEDVRKAIGRIPLVAIGGITISTVAKVLDAGADSAALISDILGRGADIESRYRELMQAAAR